MGPLHVFHGRLKSADYIDILETKFLPWYKDLCSTEQRTFLFQEDNASWHTSRDTTKWKKDSEIELLEHWPAQSPDLNPIENIWAIIEKRLCKVQDKVKNEDDLEKQIRII
jgi:hypothetical protein